MIIMSNEKQVEEILKQQSIFDQIKEENPLQIFFARSLQVIGSENQDQLKTVCK